MKTLGTKLFCYISLFIFIFFSFLFYEHYQISNRNITELLGQQAHLALKFEMAVRNYVGDKIRPVMYKLVGQEEFIPETMSTSFVAGAVFNEVKKEFPDMILKFSSDNPRNPINQASPEELEIIEFFNRNPTITTWSGIVTIDGKKYMARFNARRMEKSCLHCHGTPENAPASLIERYGDKAGFHRPLGEVIALDTVAIPLQIVEKNVWKDFRDNLLILAGGILALIITIYFVVQRLITRRLLSISEHFSQSAAKENDIFITPLDQSGDDEISLLASNFNKLTRSQHDMYLSLQEEIHTSTKINEQLQREMEERKKLEEKLRQSQKMEAIGTLAGGIAHDFNNILTPILGYSELLNMSTPDDAPQKGKILEIIKASQRAKELIRQILTFSRQGEHKFQQIQLQTITKEALKLLRSSIPSSIEIKQRINPECSLVMADPTQIHQILMNLCTNAYHAMRETGGTLGVTLDEVVIHEGDYFENIALIPGKYVKLEVSDTGIGMDKETRQRIFDPYFTTKKKGEGTGLGLAVVHGIVKGHNGHITVYSEPGHGAVFHIYFPTIEATSDAFESNIKELHIPTGNNERILIVDDEISIIEVNRDILENLGYQVTTFTDSREALAAFHNNPGGYDLIITDMTMPHLSGTDLTKEIMAIRPGLPVILCTGHSELLNKDNAQAFGIREYAMKPITIANLARIVRRVLDEGEAAAPQ
ncbi:MAG: DUF3365 domain-containing protein [Desulfobulbaceae bacterium]|nr:DUF3365 domain-containing protein [Desulfobulbaceae bacterium]